MFKGIVMFFFATKRKFLYRIAKFRAHLRSVKGKLVLFEKEQLVPKFAKGPGARKVAELVLVNLSIIVLLPYYFKESPKNPHVSTDA